MAVQGTLKRAVAVGDGEPLVAVQGTLKRAVAEVSNVVTDGGQVKEPLGEPYPIRFSLLEREALDAEAMKQYGANRKGAELVRRYVREGLARDQGRGGSVANFEAYKVIAAQVAAVRADLARIGGNLNQIAHAVNIHGTVNGKSLSDCHDELRDQFSQLIALLREVSSGLLHR